MVYAKKSDLLTQEKNSIFVISYLLRIQDL